MIYVSYILKLLIRIFVLIALFTLTRFLNYIYYYESFKDYTAIDVIKLLFYGLRSDISAILYLNFLFIFFSILPLHGIKVNNIRKKLLFMLFVIVNSAGLMLNILDNILFEYTLRRMTGNDFIKYVSEPNALSHLQQGIVVFWKLFIFWVMITLILVWVFKRTNDHQAIKSLKAYYVSRIFLIIPIMFLAIVGCRGGLSSKRPIGLADPFKYAKNIFDKILLSNSSFSVMQSLGKISLNNIIYFSEKDLLKYFYPVYQFNGDSTHSPEKPKNVIILILESFSKEFTTIGNQKKTHFSYTPFLDSIAKHSLVFENSYSNGLTSAESLPAILAGIPSLGVSFIFSQYVGNEYPSLGRILNEKGYNCFFFHGAHNGSMNFDDFVIRNGFQYYGLSEYPYEKNIQNEWGIDDEPFLSFFLDKVDENETPFFGVFFSLTSHHPFKVPLKYKDKFKDGKHPIHKVISYTDYAFSKFFAKAKKKKWFDNTLFIILADHTAVSTQSTAENNSNDFFKIPIMYFGPEIAPETSQKITQQIDIMPSLLDYLKIDTTILSFGKSIFSKSNGYVINYIGNYPHGGYYQLIRNDQLLKFQNNKIIALFDMKSDPEMINNLLVKNQALSDTLENFTKAFIQTYNHALIENKLSKINK